jgi:single-stranded-DNA-specific exonuclease
MTRPAPESRALLNVRQSVAGWRWQSRLDEAAAGRALAMAQQHGLPEILTRVLAARGVAIEAAPGFLDPKLRELMPDPSRLTDMDRAAARLADAVRAGQNIAIFGDYDVDGACSAALLGAFLEETGTPYIIHIPDRISEGYGPNVEAIRALREKGADVLVTVDCGTASHEPLGFARSIGFDAVVLDHHQAPERLPEAFAIVNPNRQDDLSGLGHLCAAGVVFMTLVAVNRLLREAGFWSLTRPEPDLRSSLDLVALATVADVVPLTGLNRAFVRQGLTIMRRRERVGLRALMDSARLNGAPEAWHMGFMLGPRINAGGRIGDAALGARLLLTQDEIAAAQIAAELDRLNGERQAIEMLAVEEGDAQAHRLLQEDETSPVLMVGAGEWHPGVVGLVASRLKERYRRPVFAMAWDETGGQGTGSGRSITGVDLGKAVRAAVEAGLAIKGGGHAMAAGITLAQPMQGPFMAFMREALAETVAAALLERALSIDAALTAGAANVALVRLIEQAGPFGAGHAEPVFAFAHHIIDEAREVGQGHVRVRLRSGDGSSVSGIAFRAMGEPLGKALLASIGLPRHVAGSLTIDRWGGGEKVSLRISDLAIPAA